MAPRVILLADDDPSVRQVVSAVLTRAGYTVLAAANGADALRISRAFPGKIDLLLTDVRMPVMIGPDLAEAIGRERPGIRIVLMSGHTSGEVPPAMQAGILHKPFLPRELLSRIEREFAAPT